MGMYSGIGSFVKKYEEGGSVPGVGGGSSSGSGGQMSFEQFVEAYGGNPGSFFGGVTARAAYQAYLNAFNATGGYVNVGTGNISTNLKTLPDYMSINDANQISFVEGVTNRQFVEGLNLLGLLDTQHSEGKTDYDWLLEWFDAGSEGAESSWLNVHLNDPCLLYTSDAADEP